MDKAFLTYLRTNCIIGILFFLTALPGKAADPVFETIMERVCQAYWEDAPEKTLLDGLVSDYASTIQADGSWSDINYADRVYTDWQPMYHLDRVILMTLAYSKQGSSWYGNTTLGNHIANALSIWYSKWPKSPDWYAHQVSASQKMAVILILMRAGATPLPAGVITNIMKMLDDTSNYGGGNYDRGAQYSQSQAYNRVAIATHWVYRACLKENAAMLRDAIDNGMYLHIPNNNYLNGRLEGLKADNAFSQHSPQLFIQGYGTGYLYDLTNIARFTRGTEYAIPESKLSILSRFARETYFNTFRRGISLYNTTGRFLSRPGELNNQWFFGDPDRLATNLRLFGDPRRIAKNLKEIDPEHAGSYEVILARLNGNQPAGYDISPSFTHYFCNEYSLYNSPAYTFDVRMASPRVNRCEHGNGENVLGYFLSDGGSSIHVDGDEYLEIFPVWQWNRIPGVTAPLKTPIPKPSSEWGTPGTSAFAGGVSDSTYGVTAYAYNDLNTTANKAWFFFGDEVVCLGANITSTALEEINTTLNQCLLKGDVFVNDAGTVSTRPKGNGLTNGSPRWIWQNKVGYVFPSGGNVNFTNKTETGNWKTNNTTLYDPQYSATISKNVFKLWINHGIKPSASGYAYIVVPGKSLEEMKAYNSDHLKIWVNSDTVQVIENTQRGTWNMVFYKTARFTNGNFTIRPSAGCALMLKNAGTGNVNVVIADPAQASSKIRLRFVSSTITTEKELECDMPSGTLKGSSKKFTISNNTPDVPPPRIGTTLYTTADAYVHGGSKTTNYGSANPLQLKRDSEGYTREIYLKFDLSGIDPASVQQAELSLFVHSVGALAKTNTWLFNRVEDDSWTESGINYNNKPATGEQIQEFSDNPDDGITLDITDVVLQEINNKNKILTIHISGKTVLGGDSWIYFYSKEENMETLRPQLFLEKKTSSGMKPVSPDKLNAYVKDGYIYTSEAGVPVQIYTLDGASTDPKSKYPTGVYIVKAGNKTTKVIVP